MATEMEKLEEEDEEEEEGFGEQEASSGAQKRNYAALLFV